MDFWGKLRKTGQKKCLSAVQWSEALVPLGSYAGVFMQRDWGSNPAVPREFAMSMTLSRGGGPIGDGGVDSILP